MLRPEVLPILLAVLGVLVAMGLCLAMATYDGRGRKDRARASARRRRAQS